MFQTYRDLIVWQKATTLAVAVYTLTKSFPKDEQFGLISQMRRAAISIPSNIAEGCGKRTNKHFAEFVTHSLGSCFELETHILICERRKYGKEEFRNKILKELSELKNMIFSFRETLESTIHQS